MPTKHIGTPEEQLALDLFIKLNRAAESVAARVSRVCVPLGVSMTQFGVLDALYHAGPMPLGELAKKHLRSPNNMTTVVDTMEKNGWVERHRCPKDRRVVWAQLTDAGRELFEWVWPRHLEAIVGSMGTIPEEKRIALAALCKELGLAQ